MRCVKSFEASVVATVNSRPQAEMLALSQKFRKVFLSRVLAIGTGAPT
jgi:hypothetical protein